METFRGLISYRHYASFDDDRNSGGNNQARNGVDEYDLFPMYPAGRAGIVFLAFPLPPLDAKWQHGKQRDTPDIDKGENTHGNIHVIKPYPTVFYGKPSGVVTKASLSLTL